MHCLKPIDVALSGIALPILLLFIVGCNNDPIPDPVPDPGKDIITLPVVIHVLHHGEAIGEGPNLSQKRIERQIEILNEDFRRKKGTRGYNEHPDGGDTMIEFILAKQDPEGNLTNGINRINVNSESVSDLGYNQNHYAQYVYWSPNQYINIWITPLPEAAQCLILGSSTGPKTDLPGTDKLSLPQAGDAKGILINWPHFGESDIDCHSKLGRTLTHEMGHYFGLLHPWGDKRCETNDYCDDTPAVIKEVFGSTSYAGCDGQPIMIENYMNYADDIVMNVFTNDQIERMYYVLKNHEGRNSLMTSPGLSHPD